MILATSMGALLVAAAATSFERDATLIEEVNAAMAGFAADKAVHAVLVYGKGCAFSAGFDLSQRGGEHWLGIGEPLPGEIAGVFEPA